MAVPDRVIPISVLNAVRYAHKALSNFFDQSLPPFSMVLLRMLFNCLFDVSTCPLV
jgi:hypothetical protein